MVEDSATLRLLVTLNLQKISDLTVVEAVDGAEGVAKAKATSPDLILTDINMPNMDGFGLIRAIRDEQKDTATPIIVITTRGEDEDAQKALDMGANAYLTKPIDGAQLIETVRSLLGL